jgi:hypothetical protein
MNHAAHQLGEIAAAAGFGLPAERQARVAARHAFVEVKRCFMHATSDLAGPGAESLRDKVRQADEAIELWLLRHQVFDALPARNPEAAAKRLELSRRLDHVFPDSACNVTLR